MWGTQTQLETKTWRERFIPTHVGNTVHAELYVSVCPVHPHACGEHSSGLLSTEVSNGSSPRMWGTLAGALGQQIVRRFIPTHVGNTIKLRTGKFSHSVHPHACGEHSESISLPWSISGSSPRMWGTHLKNSSRKRKIRFIPTHVGNTGTRPLPRPSRTVHPHACGEHPTREKTSHYRTGSSPRMWGTRPCVFRPRKGRRFIPTHVGNTIHGPSALPIGAVHPHACGEHQQRPRCSRPDLGSSPRMWGTLRRPRPVPA